MKIGLALLRTRLKGGMERDCLAIGRFLAARGHEVHLITAEPEYVEESALTVRHVPVPEGAGHARLEQFGRAVGEIKREGRFDATMSFGRVPGCDFHYAAELPFRQRPFPLNLLPRDRAFTRLEAAIYSSAGSAKTIFYLTERQRQAYTERYGEQPGRGVVVPVILHDDRRPPLAFYTSRDAVRAQYGIGTDAPLAIFIATKPLKKGLVRIFAAMRRMASLHLLVVGAVPSAALRLWAGAFGISGRVRTIAYTDDVMRLIGAADLMIHPSDEESAGLTIVESLASGVPVVVTDTCGYADLVRRWGAGVVVPTPFRAEVLSAAIRATLSDLQGMKERARSAAFDIAQASAWTEAIGEVTEQEAFRSR